MICLYDAILVSFVQHSRTRVLGVSWQRWREGRVGSAVLQGKLLQVAPFSCAPSLGPVLNQAPGFDPRGPDSPALHHLYRRVANKVSVLPSSVCCSPLSTTGRFIGSYSHKQQFTPLLFLLNKNIRAVDMRLCCLVIEKIKVFKWFKNGALAKP